MLDITAKLIDEVRLGDVLNTDPDVLSHVVREVSASRLFADCMKVCSGRTIGIDEYASMLATLLVIGYIIGENTAVDTYCSNLPDSIKSQSEED